MLTNSSVSPKVFPIRRMFVAGLVIILAFTLTTVVVWLQTDHGIAPPALRVMEAYWKFFVCRCPIFPGLFRY